MSIISLFTLADLFSPKWEFEECGDGVTCHSCTGVNVSGELFKLKGTPQQECSHIYLPTLLPSLSANANAHSGVGAYAPRSGN